ncbi:hypothetical protein [Nocardia sp. NPDC057353]|uniref:DUF7144 family membrane protein n=1 Tax=Nocardia sp. NPDC057353 TaxID=3346104 RepID=UPI0036413847
MTASSNPPRGSVAAAEPFDVRQGLAKGTALAAGVMLLTLATVSVLQGIVALLHDDLYLPDVEYLYRLGPSAWGWIHVVIGAALAICAVALLLGTRWGRFAAVLIAALAIVANFLSLPYYPAWSILVIALSAAVMWAVTTWRPTAN